MHLYALCRRLLVFHFGNSQFEQTVIEFCLDIGFTEIAANTRASQVRAAMALLLDYLALLFFGVLFFHRRFNTEHAIVEGNL